MLRNGAARAMSSTASSSCTSRSQAKPRNTTAPGPSRSMARPGARSLSRSAGKPLPERDFAQCRRILAGAGEHVVDVGPSDHEACPEADQLTLQRDIVADTAD